MRLKNLVQILGHRTILPVMPLPYAKVRYQSQGLQKPIESGSRNNRITNMSIGRCRIAAIVSLALVSTSASLLFISYLILAPDTDVPSKDAQKWIKIGQENAHKNLDKFASIFEKGGPGLKDEIKFLQSQITEAADNNRKLIAQIVDVIERIDKFLGPPGGDEPGFFARTGLKALIWYLDGTRDNKSYYLLDGAQLWCELRWKILEKMPGTPASELTQDLKSAQNTTAALRDQLDAFAQIFVQNIKRAHALTADDIIRNLVELRNIAKTLMDLQKNEKGDFLEKTKELEAKIAALVNKW